jgi:hypothetical protein
MARTPLLPQHLIQPLFEVYPHLPQSTQLIHPGITEEELQSPKDPIKYFLLSHLFLAAFKHEEIQNLITKPENLKSFIFDIELSDQLLSHSPSTTSECSLSKTILSSNFQEYIEQLHQQELQKKQELISDESLLKNLSADLENSLKKHRDNLYKNANDLNLEFDQNDMHRLFRIYDELCKKTSNAKITGLNQFAAEQASSLAEHLLNPDSEIAKTCQTALKDLAALRENFYSQIIIKYLQRLIQHHERIQELSQENSSTKSMMTWIKTALFPAENKQQKRSLKF